MWKLVVSENSNELRRLVVSRAPSTLWRSCCARRDGPDVSARLGSAYNPSLGSPRPSEQSAHESPSSHRDVRLLPWIGPFRGDESTVPRQDGVRSHDCGDLAESLPAKGLPLGSQSATLIVSEAQASSTRFELFFQNSILFDQVGDHARLLAANPAGKRGQEKL